MAYDWELPKLNSVPICPECGEECEHIYRELHTLTIIGCDRCIVSCDAWETDECWKVYEPDREGAYADE